MKNPHKVPENFSDRFALALVKFLRFLADSFFKKRYGHRAVILETVAAVPGMVGGALIHFKSLRRIQDDKGWIEKLLAEAHNERMHLMTFVNIAQPNKLERLLIVLVQVLFVLFYGLFYMISPKTAHRFVGYLEEEAVLSYTQYLEEIDNATLPNVPAPKIAIEYWNLNPNSTLRDVVLKTRKDEEDHRDVNHHFSDQL